MLGIVDSNQKIIGSNLQLNVDAAQLRSYPGSGTTWTDISGNGRNGTLVNGPTFGTANGGNIVLDGSNDYISLGTSDFGITRDFTISFWMNMSTKAVDIDVFNKGYNIPYGIYIYRASTGFMSVQGSLTSGFFTLNSVTTSYTGLKNWVAVRSNTDLYWYVNGTQDATSAGNSSNNISFSASKTWYFGSNSEVASGYFLGNIHAINIYNTALTATQVANNYNAVKSRYGL